jgi:hypothetical protein
MTLFWPFLTTPPKNMHFFDIFDFGGALIRLTKDQNVTFWQKGLKPTFFSIKFSTSKIPRNLHLFLTPPEKRPQARNLHVWFFWKKTGRIKGHASKLDPPFDPYPKWSEIHQKPMIP